MSFAAPRSTYRPKSARRSRSLHQSVKSRPQTAGASTLRGSRSSVSILGRGGATSSLAVGKPVNLGKPPKANPFRVRNSVPEQFRRFYNRGDLPVAVKHGATRSLAWKVKLQEVRMELVERLPLSLLHCCAFMLWSFLFLFLFSFFSLSSTSLLPCAHRLFSVSVCPA